MRIAGFPEQSCFFSSGSSFEEHSLILRLSPPSTSYDVMLLNGNVVVGRFNASLPRCLLSPSASARCHVTTRDGIPRAVLSAEHEGDSLVTDVPFEIVPALDCEVVVGREWISLCRIVAADFRRPTRNSPFTPEMIIAERFSPSGLEIEREDRSVFSAWSVVDHAYTDSSSYYTTSFTLTWPAASLFPPSVRLWICCARVALFMVFHYIPIGTLHNVPPPCWVICSLDLVRSVT
jgi:hypothetical protein